MLMSLAHSFKTKKLKKAIDWDGPLPSHVAIMMDGNGRWATRKGLPRTAGHYAGMNAMRETIRFCSDNHLKFLTLYAFSTENWKRPKEEVDFIINLVCEFVTDSTMRDLDQRNVKVSFIGDISRFSLDVQQLMISAAAKTQNNTGMIVNFAMNYGGRSEILHVAKALAAEGADQLTAEDIEKHLYTAGCPSPELIIRTSGEKRLSGFLLWQSAQAELWFTDKMWPSFDESMLYTAYLEYQRRKNVKQS